MQTTRWYWCLTHERVESDDERDHPENALGPYDTPEQARNWKERVEDRAEAWDEQDEAWEGSDDDADE